MARGTFANIRLRNRLVEDREGPYTVHLPDGDEGFIYDIAMRYAAEGTPLGILAGREYGSGSSRDWAAKGPALLGVRFVIAESFERIHRSNLVGMGILPLQFKPGETAATLGLSGRETLSVVGLERGLTPRQTVTVLARSDAGTERRFGVDRPPRWADRRRVLPRRRDPADRPAPAGRRLRQRLGAPTADTKKPPGEEPGASTRRSWAIRLF